MKVYPIIVTFNGLKWIDKCLGSLLGSTIPLHTIVIDNASTDGTPDYIATNYPGVELIRSAENLGFGKGNNIGMQKALDEGADYVFLLNQDAWVEPDTIENLVMVHQRHQEYGILSPVHLNADNQTLEYIFSEFAGSANTPGFYTDLYAGKVKEVYTTQFVNAAAWLISGDCLMRIGGFNPIFPHYGEDNEYVNRARYHGFKTGIVPEARIVHDSFFSWEKINGDPKRLLISNLVRLTDLNHHYRSACLLYVKESIDGLFSYLLFRKWRTFAVRYRVFLKTIGLYRKIKKYRLLALEKHAFLN